MTVAHKVQVVVLLLLNVVWFGVLIVVVKKDWEDIMSILFGKKESPPEKGEQKK